MKHPTPRVLADYLHRIADQLARDGQRAVDFAPILAARGWPASVSGDGTRSADSTTSTERSALANERIDKDGKGYFQPGPHDGIDARYQTILHQLWYTATQEQALRTEILGHASDDDPIPVGRGSCIACERFCIGDGNDRLRSGFCPTHYRAWLRYRSRHTHPSRSSFIRSVRQNGGDSGDAGHA